MQKKSFIFLTLLLAFSLLMPPSAWAGTEGDAYAALKSTALEKAELMTGDVTSVQYAVIVDGEIILSGNDGVYSKTEQTAISGDTMYGIGSVSKMFVTTAIMMLADQGKIDLNAPVTTYLPEFKMADERYKQITVRMLLNHTSGLMGTDYGNSSLFNDSSPIAHDALLKNLATQRLKAEPGEFAVYCNDGFTLSELIVERLSGITYTEFIEKNIAAPLKMNSTKTPMSTFDRSRLARTYVADFAEATPADTVSVFGAGGVYSTAEDMCRFAAIFMDKPGNSQASQILSLQSKSEMAVKEYLKGIWPKQNDNIIGFGLGWDSVDNYPFNRYGIQALVKGGDTSSYHGALMILPDYNMAAVVLASGGSSILNQMMGQELLLQALKAKDYIPEILQNQSFAAPEPVAMPASLVGMGGLYGDSTKLVKLDIANDGVLTLTIPSLPDQPAQKLVYTKEGVFVSADGNEWVSFVTESNGKTYLDSMKYINIPGLGQIALRQYEFQKMASVNIAGDVLSAWKERDGVRYFVQNEKYTSQSYVNAFTLKVELLEDTPDFAGSARIVDKNNAVSDIQIPIFAGRDLIDLMFYQADVKEYLRAGDMVFLSEKNILDIYANGSAICNIQPDGYARWYKVNAADAGKTITVNIPANGSFAVYEGNTCTQFSRITGKNTAILPATGMIVFVGDPSVCFTMVTK